MGKQFPNVHSRYGAPMGRSESKGDPGAPYKFRVYRVNLNSGGYDDGGAYWGHGAPLYCAEAWQVWDESDGTDYGNARQFMRAKDREAAKAIVREQYPNSKFFR